MVLSYLLGAQVNFFSADSVEDTKVAHLKCGEDHDGCRQIHGAPKGSLGSHLGLHNIVHVGHYVPFDLPVG
jgi:hypothetical protein